MKRGENPHASLSTDANAAEQATGSEWARIKRSISRFLSLLLQVDIANAKGILLAAFLMTVLAKVCAVAAPFFLAAGINQLSDPTADLQSLVMPFVVAVLLWGGIRLVSSSGPQMRDWLYAPLNEAAQRKLGVEAFEHVHGLSVRFHQEKRLGSLQRVLERGTRAIDYLGRIILFNIAPTLFELALAAGALAFFYGIEFSIVAIATVLLYGWLTMSVTNWRVRLRREMNEADQEAHARAADSLINYETVKAFSAEEAERGRYDQAARAYAKSATKTTRSLALLNMAQVAIMTFGLMTMIGLAGLGVIDGKMGAGDITAVILVMTNIYAPLNILGFAYREIRQAGVDMDRLFALFDERPDVEDIKGAPELKIDKGEVVFKNVGFRHDERQTGLKNISFQVEAGKSLAIVGPSGSGKSTLIRLLMRYFDTQQGDVFIDAQNIKFVTQKSLRKTLGLVPQDVVLFNETLRYNIAYGYPDASDEQIFRAIKDAQLLDFVKSLPEGLDTRVGERGLKLSGGEKQRVGLARALIKAPVILVFDEATSSLDSSTEDGVQKALEFASSGRTRITIAHRLSTIMEHDHILVLNEGQIVEEGAHHDLLEADGLYAKLWKQQAEKAETQASHEKQISKLSA